MVLIQFETNDRQRLEAELANFDEMIVFSYNCTMGHSLQTYYVYEKDRDPWTMSVEFLLELCAHLDMPTWAIRVII